MKDHQAHERLIAGVAFDIPGMGYKNLKTHKIEGFEPGVARAIADILLGADGTLDFTQVTNEERIPAVLLGRADMVLSQLTITPDRLEQVDFSVPYYVTREGILVRKDSPIRSLDDLRGKRIAVTESSISIRRMREAFPGAPLAVTKLNAGTLNAVEEGNADAASNDLVNLKLMRKHAAHPDQLEVIDIGGHFPDKLYGVAVKKGRPDFLAALNAAIERLKSDGEIDRLLRTNIG
ncbi:MAG: transporter substrate-binding domain-containing protein [Alphaproteobacteria bacterium]|jgi:putative glutamine transport system substrate-binding protein|uniref:transporter substrate-binding domain-containing protein n=1 Tax=Methyloceanibacter sp. TaxID=1965321 RepID=UPI0035614E9A